MVSTILFKREGYLNGGLSQRNPRVKKPGSAAFRSGGRGGGRYKHDIIPDLEKHLQDGRGRQGTAGDGRTESCYVEMGRSWGDSPECLRYLVGDPYPCWCQWIQIRFRVYVRYDAVYQYYSVIYSIIRLYPNLQVGGTLRM